MEHSLRLFLSLPLKRECPFASPSPSPQQPSTLPFSPPLTPYPYLPNYPTAPANDDLANKPRPPPPRPLPLNFPKHVPECKPRPLGRQRMADLRKAIVSLRRPSDDNQTVIELLNLHIVPDVPLDEFLPTDFLTQRPYMYDTDLEAMLTELRIENEDAFREVLRQSPRDGRPKPRIAYSRNFFGNLEDISRYVDSTNDNYFDATEDEAGTSTTKKDADGDCQMSTSGPTTTANKTKPMYKGPRLGNAAQLPAAVRSNAVRNILKMAIHKFNCRDYDISQKERLRIKDINLPPGLVMYNFVIARLPMDRALARARFVEGPVMSVSVRHESVFDEELYQDLIKTRERGEVGECLGPQVDLLRETGAALALALQRNREGKKKDAEYKRVTEEWWWTQQPRWGGGEVKWGMSANEVFEDEDPSWSPEEQKLQKEKRERTQAEMKKIEEAAEKDRNRVTISDMIARSEKEASHSSPVSSPGPSPTVGLLAEKTSNRIPTLTPTDGATVAAEDGSNGSDAKVATEGDEKPPKKKNRLTVPVPSPSPESGNAPADNSINAIIAPAHPQTDGSSDSTSSTSPTKVTATAPQSEPGFIAVSPTGSAPRELPRINSPFASLISRSTSGSHGGSSSRAAESKRKEDGEFKDGRRVMYTAPIRRKWFRDWTIVRPNASNWDEKVVWRRVGAPEVVSEMEQKDVAPAVAERSSEQHDQPAKEAAMATDGQKPPSEQSPTTETKEQQPQADNDDSFDEIYQLSCVNHHVALLKVRVSKRYLRWLEGKETKPKEMTEADILQLQRSKYYDLFNVAERTEFFEALWRVMCWLMRDESNHRQELQRVVGGGKA